MKAERRHDLKTNSLARTIEEVPTLARQHGNKVLLSITVVLLGIVLYRYRANQAAQTDLDAKTALSAADTAINSLWYAPLFDLSRQEAMAGRRDMLVTDAEANLDQAMRAATDPSLRADGYVARGNLNWLLATLPRLPAAATRPTLDLKKSSSDYLAAAESAYNEVLKAPLSNNGRALTSARLGLAAIAENRHDWETANRYYQLVQDASATAEAMREYAKIRQKALDDLKRPVLLANGTGVAAPVQQPAPIDNPSSILGPMTPLSLDGVAHSAGPATSPSSAPAISPSTKSTATQPATAPVTK